MSEEQKQEETQEEDRIPFDPKQVEEEMIKMAQARADDPVESASTMYGMYVPHFKRLLPKMSTRGLRRVLQYLVLYPLEVDSVKSASENEKQFMQLVNSLVECKFVMQMSTYAEHAEKLLAASENVLTKEEEDQVVTELKKGGVSDEEIEKLRNKTGE